MGRKRRRITDTLLFVDRYGYAYGQGEGKAECFAYALDAADDLNNFTKQFLRKA